LISLQYFYNILQSVFNVLHENFVVIVRFFIRFFCFVFSGLVGGEINAAPSSLADADFTCTLGAGKGQALPNNRADADFTGTLVCMA
jgi:hypothetical protein